MCPPVSNREPIKYLKLVFKERTLQQCCHGCELCFVVVSEQCRLGTADCRLGKKCRLEDCRLFKCIVLPFLL